MKVLRNNHSNNRSHYMLEDDMITSNNDLNMVMAPELGDSVFSLSAQLQPQGQNADDQALVADECTSSNNNTGINPQGGGTTKKKKSKQKRKSPSTIMGSTAATATSNTMISVPSRNDVLLGRGKGYFSHVGNVRYRSLIEDLADKYNAASKDIKHQITKEVMEIICHKAGGRFLKDDGAGWVVVDHETARLKVSHSFRSARKAALQQAANPTNNNKNNRMVAASTTSSSSKTKNAATSSTTLQNPGGSTSGKRMRAYA